MLQNFFENNTGQYNINQLNSLQYVPYNKFPSENISPHFCRNKYFTKRKIPFASTVTFKMDHFVVENFYGMNVISINCV